MDIQLHQIPVTVLAENEDGNLIVEREIPAAKAVEHGLPADTKVVAVADMILPGVSDEQLLARIVKSLPKEVT